MKGRIKWAHAVAHALGYGLALWFIRDQDIGLVAAHAILVAGAVLSLSELLFFNETPPKTED